MTEKLQRIIYSVIVLIYIFLINKIPVSIYSNAMHDDALFIFRAQDIVAGNWAGSVYNQFILAKGLGFSLFEAFNYFLGLPITLTIGLVNIAMAFFLKNTIEKFYKNEYFLMVFFIFILFSPILIPQRIIRDNIYFALTVFSAIGFMRILLMIDANKKLAFFYGFIFGLFWITREEGAWVFPALVFSIFLVAKIYGINYFINVYKNLFIYISSACVIIFMISGINLFKYGIFATNDFKEKNFQAALEAIYSVRTEDPVPYLSASKDKREILYKVSPSFGKLKDYFDGSGMGWTNFGCEEYPLTCGDYASGWFMWALRDATASIGFYQTPNTAKIFYKSIADEIDLACSSGEVPCRHALIGFLPPMRKDQWDFLPEALLKGVKKLAYFDGQEPVSESSGQTSKINEYGDFLGRPLVNKSNASEMIYVSGWAQAENNQWFRLDCIGSEGKISFHPARKKSPDILINGLSGRDVRFEFEVRRSDQCTLLMDDGHASFNINDSINLPGMKKVGNSLFQFDNFNLIKMNSYKSISLNYFFKLYGIALSFLLPLGFLCFIYNLFCFNKYKELILEFSAWILVATRLVLLSLIDISTFHAMNYQYLGPIFIIIIFASFLSFANAFNINFKALRAE
jgi:hypothetical protein